MEREGKASDTSDHVPYSVIRGFGTEAQIQYILGLRAGQHEEDEFSESKILAKLARLQKKKALLLRLNEALENDMTEIHKDQYAESKELGDKSADVAAAVKKLMRLRRELNAEKVALDHTRKQIEDYRHSMTILQKKVDSLENEEDDDANSRAHRMELTREYTPEVFQTQRQIAWFEKTHPVPGFKPLKAKALKKAARSADALQSSTTKRTLRVVNISAW
jgi:hypothetical protein